MNLKKIKTIFKIRRVNESDLNRIPFANLYDQNLAGWRNKIAVSWLVFYECAIFAIALLETGFWYAVTGYDFFNPLYWLSSKQNAFDPVTPAMDSPFSWIEKKEIWLSLLAAPLVYLLTKIILSAMFQKVMSIRSQYKI